MTSTGETTDAVPQKEAPQEYVPLLFERFEERTNGALAPPAMPAYRQHRRKHWPKKSGFTIDQQAERNDYHFQRDATHRHEAIGPGVHESVPMTDVRRGEKSDTRREKVGQYTKKVYNREEGCYEWVQPTRWAPGQYVCVPKFAIANTSTSPAERAVLTALWAYKDLYEWHTNFKPVVKNIHQDKIGDHAGISGSYVSRVTTALAKKGFLTKKGGGNGDRCTYYLAARELASWTYRALDPDSARSRVQKMLQKSAGQIDWSRATSMSLWHQRRRTKPQKDAAQRKLEEDQKRTRDGTGPGKAGEALASALAGSWEAFKEYGNASADERHERWKENRNGPAPPG